MFSGHTVWGIDIGQAAIKAVRLDRSDGRVELVDYDIVPYEKPLPDSGEERRALITAALKALRERKRIRSQVCAVSLPGHTAFNRMVKLPRMEKRRIPEIMQYEARQQIPFKIEDVIWDYQPFAEDFQTADDFEVALFAVKREDVDEIHGCLKQADLGFSVLQLAPLALYNYVKHDQGGDGFVVIDFGSKTTDVVVDDGARFWLRTIRYAGNDITKALQEKLRVSYEEAENLKVKVGATAQREKILQILQPILRDILGEIQRSLGFYKSQYPKAKLDRIIAMGNALRLSGLEKFLRESLQYEFLRPSLPRRMAVASHVPEPTLKAHFASLGVAIGLALQGLGLGQCRINLAPASVRKSLEFERRKPFILAASWLILAIALAELLGASLRLRGAGATEVGALQVDATALQTLTTTVRKEIADSKKQRDDAEARLQQISAFFERDRTAWFKIVNAVHEAAKNDPIEIEKVEAALLVPGRSGPAEAPGDDQGAKVVIVKITGKVGKIVPALQAFDHLKKVFTDDLGAEGRAAWKVDMKEDPSAGLPNPSDVRRGERDFTIDWRLDLDKLEKAGK